MYLSHAASQAFAEWLAANRELLECSTRLRDGASDLALLRAFRMACEREERARADMMRHLLAARYRGTDACNS